MPGDFMFYFSSKWRVAEWLGRGYPTMFLLPLVCRSYGISPVDARLEIMIQGKIKTQLLQNE